jgi:hypothetical protein
MHSLDAQLMIDAILTKRHYSHRDVRVSVYSSVVTLSIRQHNCLFGTHRDNLFYFSLSLSKDAPYQRRRLNKFLDLCSHSFISFGNELHLNNIVYPRTLWENMRFVLNVAAGTVTIYTGGTNEPNT